MLLLSLLLLNWPGEPEYRLIEVAAPGDHGYAHRPSGGAIHAARSLLAQRDLIKFVKAGDRTGLDDLVAADEAVIVADGTAFRVLTITRVTNPTSLEVRLLDGRHQGEIVYMAAPWCFEKVIPRKKR